MTNTLDFFVLFLKSAVVADTSFVCDYRCDIQRKGW